MTTLKRFGVQACVMKRVKASREIDRANTVPKEADDLQGFLETADRFGEIKPVGDGVLGFAAAEPKDEPPPRKMIDRQRGLRQQRWVPPHGVDDTGRNRYIFC